jgi:hypothetical protein
MCPMFLCGKESRRTLSFETHRHIENTWKEKCGFAHNITYGY